MKKIFFSLLLIFLAFLSCKKDSDPTHNFKFTISDNYIPDNYQIWIVVSDNKDVLYMHKIQNGNTYEVKDIKADLVDVHVFRYYEYLPIQDLRVVTYNDVTPDEWYLDRPYPSTYLGSISASVSDLADFKNLSIASSRSSTSYYSMTSPYYVNAYVDPENILISYLPSDNSPMKYKYVQNISPEESLDLVVSDFQTASGLISYSLPSYNQFSYNISGYKSNYNDERYRFCYTYYTGSSLSTLDLYYPSGLFQNYSSSFHFIDEANITRHVNFVKFGALPTSIPTISYADVSLANETNIDQVSASVANSQNYEEFDFDYWIYQSNVSFSWFVETKSQATVSNSLPDIPYELKQKSTLFDKENLEFYGAYLYKYIDGDASTFNDYINMCIKPSVYFNEVVPRYNIYYQYPALTEKKAGNDRVRLFSGEGKYFDDRLRQDR
jgi:hypothetical protein